MDLRNWEFYTSGNAVVGADVYVYEASLSHPNPNSALASTTTDSNGMWAFAALSDSAKDVKVSFGGKDKWYKGLTRHSVGVVFIDDYPTSDFAQLLGQASVAAPAAGLGRLYFKTDGKLYSQYGASGERPVAGQTGYAAGTTASPSTTSTTYADIPEMAVTLTTRGGDLLVWLTGTFYNPTSGANGYAALALDGAAEVAEQLTTVAGPSFADTITCVHRFSGVAAGAHTVKGRWKTNSGTLFCLSTSRNLLVVETGG